MYLKIEKNSLLCRADRNQQPPKVSYFACERLVYVSNNPINIRYNISSFLHLTRHTIIYIHVQKTTRILQVQETLYLVRIPNYNFQKEEIYNL